MYYIIAHPVEEREREGDGERETGRGGEGSQMGSAALGVIARGSEGEKHGAPLEHVYSIHLP